MTREDEARELLAVTQDDRDAAADLLKGGWQFDVLWHPQIREGERDDHVIVQAFAKHRLAITRPSSPASVEVERLLADAARQFERIKNIERALADGAYYADDPECHPSYPCLVGSRQSLEKAVAALAALTVPARPEAGDDTDWHCGVCMCRTYARVDELKADNKFHPSNIVRCVGCKATHLLPLPTARADIGEAQVIDLDAIFWESIKQAAAESKWIPREHYFMNDWVSDCCDFLRNGPSGIGEDAAQHFKVGDRVTKVKGLPFGNGDARVVAVYSAEGGSRVVVQHPEGWQHIFAPDQLALASLQSSGRDAGEGM